MGERLIHQPSSIEHDLPVFARRRRRLLLTLGAVVLVVIAALLYTQTNTFGRRVLGGLLGGMDDLRVHADSFRFVGSGRVKGTNIEVADASGEVLFRAESLNLGFGVWDWFRRRIELSDIEVEGGYLLVRHVDVDAKRWQTFLSRVSGRRGSRSKPLRDVSLSRVRFSDCELRFLWPDRAQSEVRVAKLNYAVDDFAASEISEHQLSGTLLVRSDLANQAEIDFEGAVALSLWPTALPKEAEGSIQLECRRASGRMAELAKSSGSLRIRLKEDRVADTGIFLSKQGAETASISLTGPYDSSKNEGRVMVEFNGFRRPQLNLAFALAGVDFGESLLDGRLTVDSAYGGSLLSLRGAVAGEKFEIIKGDNRSPQTEVIGELAFQLSVDEESLLLQSFQLEAIRGEAAWLLAELGSPAVLNWGGARPGIKEPRFQLGVTDLDLAAWGSFIGWDLPPGLLTFAAETTIKLDGRFLESEIKGRINNLEVVSPAGNRLDTSFGFEIDGQLEDFDRLSVLGFKYDWQESDQSLLRGDGVFSVELEDATYRMQLAARGGSVRLLEESGLAGWGLDSGDLDSIIRVGRERGKSEVSGSMTLSALNGSYRGWGLKDHRISTSVDANFDEDQILLNSLTFESRSGFQGAGRLGVNGKFDSVSGTGELRLKSVGIDRDFFGSALAEYVDLDEVANAELNVSADAKLDLKNQSKVRLGVSVQNLGGRPGEESSGRISGTVSIDRRSLGMVLGGDLVFDSESVEIEDGSLEFYGSTSPTNLFRFTGTLPILDGAKASLEVESGKVDLTDYYDWSRRAILSSPPSATAMGHSRDSRSELGLNGVLPVEALTVGVALEEFYLGAMALTNLSASVELSRDTVVANQFESIVNGGRMSGFFARSQSEFESDLAVDLKFDQVPLTPVLYTFGGGQGAVEEPSDFLTGQIVLDGQLGRQATTPTEFAGEIDLAIENPVLPPFLVDGNPWIAPLVWVLNPGQVDPLKLESARGKIVLRGSSAQVETVSVKTAQIELETSGSLSFTTPLRSTPLGLPVRAKTDGGTLEVGSLEGSLGKPEAKLLLEALARMRGDLD